MKISQNFVAFSEYMNFIKTNGVIFYNKVSVSSTSCAAAALAGLASLGGRRRRRCRRRRAATKALQPLKVDS